MQEIYTPNSRNAENIFQMLRTSFRDTMSKKDLITQLVKRDFIAQYKKALLGVTWHIITPLVSIISWIFLNYAGLLTPGDIGVPYPAFVLIGTTFWSIFVGYINASSDIFNIASGFLQQVNFPRHALLVKQIINQSITIIINLAITFIALFFFDIIPSWKSILVFIYLAPLLFLACSIGLITSILSIAYNDFRKAVNFGLTLFMFITPVIYKQTTIENPLIRILIDYNPIGYLLIRCRDLIFKGMFVLQLEYFLILLISIAIFIISYRFYYVSEEKLIEKMY